jgi:hypothetical protein
MEPKKPLMKPLVEKGRNAEEESLVAYANELMADVLIEERKTQRYASSDSRPLDKEYESDDKQQLGRSVSDNDPSSIKQF